MCPLQPPRYIAPRARVVILVVTLAGLAFLAPSGMASPIILDEHVEYPTGGEHPAGLALADLDSDGRPDITSTSSLEGQEISVLLNLGDGTFGMGTQHPGGASTRFP